MKRAVFLGLLLLILVGLLLGHWSLGKGFVPSRVEILCGERAEAVRQVCAAVPELVADEPVWEEDRLVFSNPDLFTAQRAGTVLAQAGLADESLVLDYSWASEMLAQSGRLWQVGAAFAALWLLFLTARWQVCLELQRGRAAWKHQYLGAYLSDASVPAYGEGHRLCGRGLRRGAVGAVFDRMRCCAAGEAAAPGQLVSVLSLPAMAGKRVPGRGAVCIRQDLAKAADVRATAWQGWNGPFCFCLPWLAEKK